ncbi:MAG TPA: PorV/PorQ family protein [Candidatus Marinimicrobia bacterium]|nr:PorV/PorQ family protein [Candidatus Neomarinimicrobiota bacterium]
MKRLFILTGFCITVVFSQNNVATTSAAFLEIGPGARSLGMGSAFVSVADDASALYWNPAGIVYVSRPEVQTYYSPWLVETQFYYNTAVIPMGGFGNLGISFTAVTMDEMMVRTVQDPEPNKYGQKFDAGNISMGIAYAKKLTDRFSFGFQTKFIQESIWQMKAQGIAVDIGTLFITKNNLRIGMSVSNFGGKMGMEGINTLVDIDVDENIYGNNDRIDGHLDAAKWPLPLMFRFGLSREFVLNPNMKYLVAVDAIHPNNNPEYLNVGVEYSAMDMVFLRLGQSHTLYQQNFFEDGVKIHEGSEQGISVGMGIKYQIPRGPNLRIDYVFTEFGVFNDVQGYSISVSF